MAAGININMAVVANVSDAVRGLNRATDSVKKLDEAVNPANDNLGRLERLLQGKGGGNRFFRTGLQQTGYQVGDFAVQVANGTSAMQAFGQQAPQLLQIFGPIGAIVGAAVSIFAAIAVAFEKTGDAAEKAKPKIASLSDITSQLNSASRAVANTFNVDIPESLDAAKEKYGELNDEIIRTLKNQRELSKLQLFKSIADTTSSLRTSVPQLAEYNNVLRDITLRGLEVDRAQGPQLQKAAEAFLAATKEFDALPRFTGDLSDGIDEVMKALSTGDTNKAISSINEIVERLALVGDKTLNVRKELTDYALTLQAITKESEAAVGATGRLKDKIEDMGRIRTGEVPIPQTRPENVPFEQELAKVQQQIDTVRLSMDLINIGGFSPELANQAAALKVQLGLTNEQMSVLVPKLQELEQLKTPVQSLQESFMELADTVLNKVSNAFANAFTGIVNGTKSVSQAFKEMVGSILADFARMMAQKAAASLLGSLFGSLLGGGGGGYTGNVFGAPVPGFTQPLALGGVLSGGNITPFARGGVVNRPTLFPMAKGAGLMGEAGPEAIMPLTRGPDGKLGVAGGGANVNVNIINQAGADVETKQNGPDIDVIIRRAVTSDIANGGQIYRAIGQRFETSTRLTRR